MAELIPWRAVLAPLGEPGIDGRTLAPTLRMTAFGPLPLMLDNGRDPNRLIGQVDMAGVDAARGEVIAAGQVDPSVIGDGDSAVVNAMRAGELVPTLVVDTVTIEDDQVTSCRVMHVAAVPASTAMWPGRVRFDLSPA